MSIHLSYFFFHLSEALFSFAQADGVFKKGLILVLEVLFVADTTKYP